MGMFSSDLAIDLGTANTVVYVKGKGIVINEPSVIAVETGSTRLKAVGSDAKKMLGRVPHNIQAIRPLKDGKISDVDMAEEMLKYFIRKAHNRSMLIHPRVIISVPSQITKADRDIVKRAGRTAGARDVQLVDEPLAAAIGAGLPINDAGGNLIVDIGGGTTEVGLISLSNIVYSFSASVGGDKMNESIVDYIRKTKNIEIGENSAEQIKIELGTAVKTDIIKETQIRGQHIIRHIPQTVTINSDEIKEALEGTVQEIVNAIMKVLDKTPPALAGDIMERGIVITGGGALLNGLDKVIRNKTEVPVSVADNPLLSVVMGAGKMLDDIHFFKNVIT
ncbi:rod shape-determining protein [bacterium]|nr:rod shape-determining protein [bacterium]